MHLYLYLCICEFVYLRICVCLVCSKYTPSRSQREEGSAAHLIAKQSYKNNASMRMRGASNNCYCLECAILIYGYCTPIFVVVCAFIGT